MNTINNFYNKWKKFFIINLAISIFSYFMLISLQLLNQLDAIWHFGYGGAGNWERGIGRWFWPTIDELRFGLFTDPFCNTLALCIFILGNIFLFETIEWSPDKFRTYTVSTMFIVSTSVCAWLSFRYMSNTFAIAYFLSVFAIYICKRCINCSDKEAKLGKKSERLINLVSVAAASVALMLSLASYQAFLDSACIVAVLSIMLMLYRGEDTGRIICFFVRTVASVICGGILYFIGMKITFIRLGIQNLNGYNAGSSLGLLNTIEKIPKAIDSTIYYFRHYFFDTLFRWNRLQEHVLFRIVFFGILAASLVVALIRISRKNRVYAILFAMCALLLPIATNVVLFLATESYLSIQMTNGLALFVMAAFILIFEILFTDNGDITEGQENSKKKSILLYQSVNAIVVISSLLVIYGNYISVQIDQEACREGTNATVTLASEILDSMKNIGFVDNGETVCFVGTPCGNERFMYSEIYPMANELMQFGNWGTAASTHGQTWTGIYREHLGYYVKTCTDEEYESIIERPDVINMPMYPKVGSMKKIDGIIVVKVSNNY